MKTVIDDIGAEDSFSDNLVSLFQKNHKNIPHSQDA